MNWFGYQLDLFELYSAMLFVFVTIYYILVFSFAGLNVGRVLSGTDKHKQLLRTYISYHLVTLRVGPLMSELLQILLWCFILIGIWYFYWLLIYSAN